MTGRLITSTADTYYLKRYVLFEYNPTLTMVNGKIIYVTKNNDPKGKTWTKLLNSVYQFIREKRVETWKIYSISFHKLISYYESFGFEQYDTIYIRGKAKVVEMKIIIEYQENQSTEKNISENDDFDDY